MARTDVPQRTRAGDRLLAFIDRAQQVFGAREDSDRAALRASIALMVECLPATLSSAEAAVVRLTLIRLLVGLMSTPSARARVAWLGQLVQGSNDPAAIGRSVLTFLAQSTGEDEHCLSQHLVASDTVRRAVRYINQMYSRADLTLQSVASNVSVSRCHLARLMKRGTGIGFRGHVHRARTDAASRLLSDSGKSIKEVAYEVGYAGTRELDRNFKRRFGCTPTEFRSQPTLAVQAIQRQLVATDLNTGIRSPLAE